MIHPKEVVPVLDVIANLAVERGDSSMRNALADVFILLGCIHIKMHGKEAFDNSVRLANELFHVSEAAERKGKMTRPPA